MVVVQLLSSLADPDGARSIYALYKAINKRHQCYIIAQDDEKSARFGEDFFALNMPKKSAFAWLYLPRLIYLLNKLAPDIIHVHARTPAWVLTVAMRFLRKKAHIIATIYGFYPYDAYSRAIMHADTLIAASRSIADYMHRTWQIDSQVVPRGVDLQIYPYRYHAPLPFMHSVFGEYPHLAHKRWLLFPTPIADGQGDEWLADILGNLSDEKLHIVIADDPQGDHLHTYFCEKMHALALENRFTFIGKNVRLKDWIASSDIVLALGDTPQSLGMTALIAIHLGTKVVGWDKGAHHDILAQTYPDGLIIGNDAKSLCRTIESVLHHADPPKMTHAYCLEGMLKDSMKIYHAIYQNLQIN